jgi:hypothetical protein
MNIPATSASEILVLLPEIFFGLCVLGIVAIYNVYSFLWVGVAYRKVLQTARPHGKHFEILRFIGFTIILVFFVLSSILPWVLALSIFQFVPHWVDALLFSISFFTTVGNFSVNMPFGWRIIPSMIAFSGLFTFAWATATSMGMISSLIKHLAETKQL